VYFVIYFELKFITKIIPMFFGKILTIDEVLVRSEITDTPFVCNLAKCKGACCTLESDFGAPVSEEEIKQIEEILPIVKQYLPQEHIDEIDKNGFYDFRDNEFMLKSMNRKACVFVYFDGDIAKCGMEKAFLDGKTNFKKPISCHLFPIRVSKFGGEILRYEEFSECKPALEKGKEENITIAEFCKESLIRLYGNKWYSQLKDSLNK
jgi:hypothetical protein